MKIQCLLVDDEPIALDVIELYARQVDMLEVAGKCRSAVEAFTALQHKKIDLMFLDIQMPQLSGLELLKTLPHPPKVIITSAYRQYALEGYEFDVVDYLIKPVPFERFMKAVGKVLKGQAPVAAPAPPAEEPFIFVKEDRKLIRVFLHDILFLESLRDYVRITTASRQITTRQTIAYYEELLPPEQFVRIHRSFIVALSKIEAISENRIEVLGQALVIGGNYKQRVFEKLKIATGVGQLHFARKIF
jgi:DNA-binding LytR/AlgR family response regulator